MKYSLNLFIAILFILIVSCSNDQKKQTEENPKTYHLKGEKILEDKFNTYDLYVLDTLLLTKNMAAQDSYLFSLYNLKDLSFICDFMKLGNGPNEFEEMVEYSNYYSNDDGLNFWVYEVNRNKFSYINVEKVINGNKNFVEKEIRVKPGLGYNSSFFIEKNLIAGNVGNLDLKMSRLRFYDINKEEIVKNIKLLPEYKNKKENDLVFTQQTYNPLFLNSLQYSQKRELFVSPMIRMDRIDVFSKNGELINTINEDSNISFEKLIENKKNDKVKVFFTDIEFTNDYFYCLYSGDLENEYYQKMPPVKVKVYDWNYKLKFIIELDESINFISIDEKTKTLFGVSVSQEKVMKYNLK